MATHRASGNLVSLVIVVVIVSSLSISQHRRDSRPLIRVPRVGITVLSTTKTVESYVSKKIPRPVK
jgi:hypothetical protein